MEFSGFQLIVTDGLGVTINDNAKIAKKRTLRYKLSENYTILTREEATVNGHWRKLSSTIPNARGLSRKE